jgi:poly(A) polymerase
MPPKAGPELARAAALAIVRQLREAGHVAYFAGGCVRDELLSRAPTDYDIATDATPKRIGELFRRTNEVGAAFGVVLVTLGPADGLEGQATVEVATFRSEGPYSDRRRPDQVRFSDPQADALRRDFTVNALFLDPLPHESHGTPALHGAAVTEAPPPSSGRIIDFVGGLHDLKQRVIRAVGDPEQRLAEDHLRALRAVRLSARLGFTLDPGTAAAIHRHARDLAGVSRERIGEELRRMLLHPTRGLALGQLQDLELDAPVLVESPQNTPLYILNQARLEGSATIIAASLAAWAIDRGLALNTAAIEDLAVRWRRALCLSNPETAALRDTLICLQRLIGGWESWPVAMQKRLAGGACGFGEALAILTALDPARAGQVQRRLLELAQTPGGLTPQPLLTGDDLVAAGFHPGPAFKAILDKVYDAQLEGRVNSRTQAMELAKNLRI